MKEFAAGESSFGWFLLDIDRKRGVRYHSYDDLVKINERAKKVIIFDTSSEF